MSRQSAASHVVTVCAVLVGLLGLSGSATAGGDDESVCHHPRTLQCRSLHAGNAFLGYAERHWAISHSTQVQSCHGPERRRWHCTLRPEGGGVPATCTIIGTVVEPKPNTWTVGPVRASQSCPKRRGSG
jgi:hypothetical protein